MSNKNSKKLAFMHLKSDDGFVLITALMVIFLVISIVSTVALVTAADMKASARARAIIKTRFVAESVSDTIYARIAGLKRGFLAEARKYGIDESISPVPGNNPLVALSPADPWGDWFALDDNGSLKTCEYKDVCFKAKMNQVSSGSVVEVSTRDEVSLDLVVRGGCYGTNLSDIKGCVYRQFQTRYRTRSYIDTASIANTERSTLAGIPDDPADSTKKVRVALLPSDQVSGAVQTNDPDGYLFCGQVNYDNSLLRYLDSGNPVTNLKQYLDSSNTSCDYSSSPSPIGKPQVLLPSQISTKGTSLNVQTVYEHLAGTNYKLSGGNTLKLLPGGIEIDGVAAKYPSNGVIFVSGSLTITESQYDSSLTIFATGNVRIEGNIRNIGTDSLLGIAARGDIVINCNAGTQCPDREIDSVLNAGSRIYNNSWNDSPTGAGTAPEIKIVGALVANERPIFGSYLTTSDAELVNGWKKNIQFDTRLLDNQPPFFFRTTQASIVRSSMDEGRCTESFC